MRNTLMLIITTTLTLSEKQLLQKRGGVQLERVRNTSFSHNNRHVIANANRQRVTVIIEERSEAGERLGAARQVRETLTSSHDNIHVNANANKHANSLDKE